MSFNRPDGKSVNGYLAEPAQPQRRPAWCDPGMWGLNDQIKGVADKLAKSGIARSCRSLSRQNRRRREGGEPSDDRLNFGMRGQDIRGAVQY